MSEESGLYIGKIEKEVPVQSGDDDPLMRIQELTTMAAGLVAIKTERDELRAVLISLKRSPDHQPDCWCGKAIGNPMLKDHSAACKAAKAALKGGGG